jgi:hypothetical protein
MDTADRASLAAPTSPEWMFGTRTMAEVQACDAMPTPSLEEIAHRHLQLLQHLDKLSLRSGVFDNDIALTKRALGMG